MIRCAIQRFALTRSRAAGGWASTITARRSSNQVEGVEEGIPNELRVRAAKVRRAVQEARDASVLAAAEGSDDVDRDRSVGKGRLALKVYSDLLEIAGEEHKEKIEAELGDAVDKMKHELYMSRKQRVWMGWRGWF